ncbi:MAG: hypothetical protein IJP29_08035 [Lachnospiraceae bacterium]|nr:hypothetical protein [Lachnospiraceae bacterium]
MGSDTINEIWRESYYVQPGIERMKIYKRGWEEADKCKDYNNQIEFRIEYMQDACFYDDVMEIYIVMPELLKLHDEYMAEYGENPYTGSVMWNYKWILGNAMDFYQITEEQFEAFTADFKNRCLQYGFSLRTYYEYCFMFYKFSNWEKADYSYKMFMKCNRDRLSDCIACERDVEIDYLLAVGDIEKALLRAKPLLNRNMTCAEVPEITYGKFLRYYNFQIADGNNEVIEIANEYSDKIRNSITRKKIAQEYQGDVLLNYSLTNPTKGLTYYKRNWGFFEKNRNPVQKFYFAVGVIRLFKNMNDKSIYKMKLPSNHPLYQEGNEYEISTVQKYYDNYAIDMAKKLDYRNKNTYYMDVYKRYVEV